MSAVQSTTLPWMLLLFKMTTNFLKQVKKLFPKKSRNLKQLPFDFFLLLSAFVYGNVFAIQNSRLEWNSIVIFGIIFCLEIVEKIVSLFFKKKRKTETSTFFFFKFIGFENTHTQVKVQNSVMKTNKKKFLPIFEEIWIAFLLNLLKRGFLLGFFLEAFKVGS